MVVITQLGEESCYITLACTGLHHIRSEFQGGIEFSLCFSFLSQMNVGLRKIIMWWTDLRMVMGEISKNGKGTAIVVPLHKRRGQFHGAVDILRIQDISSIEEKKIICPIDLLVEHSCNASRANRTSHKP